MPIILTQHGVFYPESLANISKLMGIDTKPLPGSGEHPPRTPEQIRRIRIKDAMLRDVATTLAREAANVQISHYNVFQ